MLRHRSLFLRSALLIVLFLPVGLWAREVPYLSGRVNDTAAMLRAETVEALEAKLAAHEAETSNQVVILTIDSLQGEVLEEYSIRVAETWKIGQADKDNGVILLIARDDRKMRLEVGQGLEGALTDAMSRRILDNVVRPAFKRGEFDEGVSQGVDAILGVIKGEYEPPSDVESASSGFEDIPIFARIVFGGFIFFVLGVFTFFLVITKKFQWFVYFFLIPFWAIFPAIPLGIPGNLIALLVYLLGVPILRLLVPKFEFSRKWRTASPNWTTSSSGGGWSSGGSSGGFSGGGGSFSGGGASSSW